MTSSSLELLADLDPWKDEDNDSDISSESSAYESESRDDNDYCQEPSPQQPVLRVHETLQQPIQAILHVPVTQNEPEMVLSSV
jgi:hypothetical protein